MKILVVDDYRKSLQQLQKILDKAGHEVLTASDGIEAFHIYQENEVDMAFIDWTMPRMSGIELCHRIRDYNLKTGQVSYLILVTSKSKKRNMVEGLDAGVDDFVMKPYSEDVILSRVAVAERVLETKYNKIPKVQPLEDKVIEPIALLNHEHVLINKMTGVLEVMANMLGEGRPLPKKLLTWGTSSAFILNWQLHEEKELFYIDLFVERAQEIHGKTSQLFSRSSLTQILKEHELIKKLLLELQDSVKLYDVNNRKTALDLRTLLARYIPLIRFHAAREEYVFLPFSQRYLTEDDVARIMEDFERVEGEIGKDTIQSRLDTVEQLEKILKITEKAV